MRCERFAGWIALDVEGDLAPRRAAKVQAHLESCGSCRQIAEELRRSQYALKALAGAPLPEDDLTAVSAAVMARLPAAVPAGPSAVPGWLAPALAAAAAIVAVAVGGWLWSGRSGAPAPMATPESAPAEPAPLAAGVEPTVPEAQTAARLSEPAAAASARPTLPLAAAPAPLEPAPRPVAVANHETMLIKLVSDRQDIVIYWLVEPKEIANEPVEETPSA